MVLLQKLIVMLGEIGGCGEEGVEFGIYDCHGFFREGGGKGGDCVLEVEDLGVGGWVGGGEGVGG